MAGETELLLEFIGAAKAQGACDEFLVSLLRQNGWSEKRIYQSFGAWYAKSTGMTVPAGGGRIEAARDAFLYLISFITLGIWSIQLCALFFAAIERAVPNAALGYGNSVWETQSFANQLASIIVAFPLFLLIMHTIVRGVRRHPERQESSVRKWLTYLALVITASIMICDVVAFLAYFLRGDLSTRFLLKVITILVVAGGIFTYFLDSLRSEAGVGKRNRVFGIAAAVAVTFGVIIGFAAIGSPVRQRTVAEDSRRLSDLSSLAQGLHDSWMTRKQEFVLPTTVSDLQLLVPSAASVIDPVTGEPYEYAALAGTAYRLCATFALPSSKDTPVQWHHRAGRACFNRNANDDVQAVVRPW